MMKILLSCSYDEEYLYINPEANIKKETQQTVVPSTLYYDLQGRKVANPTRGIYIKDGKKIAVD